MSIFNAGIKRNQTGEAKEEDYSKIYYAHTDNIRTINLVDDTYKDYWYTVGSQNGRFPVVRILCHNGLSIYAGKAHIQLPDRNGEMQKMDRANNLIFHMYNQDGDYEDGRHPGIRKTSGKKYTVEELTADAKAFIDQIIKDESEFTNHMDD